MKRVKWDYASVKEEAGKYSRTIDFKRGSRGAYDWAERNGVVKEVTAGYPPGTAGARRKYTREYVRELASTFVTFKAFFAAYPVAVCKASTYGYYDELDHLERSTEHAVTDNDAVYCWVVTDAANDDLVSPMPGHRLCKIGVTSARLGDQRPALCAAKNSMSMELIGIMETRKGEATDYERLLLSLGTEAGVPHHYDGYTEFRIFTDEEVNKIERLLCA